MTPLRIAYTVRCTFKSRDVGSRWLEWLKNGHLADVRAAGAQNALAVVFDGDPLAIEARYLFASRADFEIYLRDHMPRLRAEGLALFPLELGLSYERFVGEVVAED